MIACVTVGPLPCLLDLQLANMPDHLGHLIDRARALIGRRHDCDLAACSPQPSFITLTASSTLQVSVRALPAPIVGADVGVGLPLLLLRLRLRLNVDATARRAGLAAPALSARRRGHSTVTARRSHARRCPRCWMSMPSLRAHACVPTGPRDPRALSGSGWSPSPRRCALGRCFVNAADARAAQPLDMATTQIICGDCDW